MSLFRITLALLVLTFGGAHAWAAPPLAAYGSLPAIEFVSLSPSGDRFAFVAVDGEQRRLFVRKVGGDALSVVKLGDAKVWRVAWAGNDDVVTLTSRTENGPDSAEQMMAVVLDVASGKSYRLFHGRADVDEAIAGYEGARRVDGRWQGLFRAVSRGLSPDIVLYRVDLASGNAARVSAAGARGLGWVIGEGGDIVARTGYDPATRQWRLWDGPSGDRVIFRKASPLGQVEVEGYGRTPGTVVVLNSTGEEDRYDEIDLNGGDVTALPGAADYASLFFNPLTRRLIGAQLTGGGAVFFDPVLQGRYDAVRETFAGRSAHLISYDAAFERLIVFTDGGDDSGTYWLLDTRTHAASKLAAAKPAIAPADVGPTSLVDYKAADGLGLEGVLTLPPGRQPHGLPLVVMPHGGPIGIHDRVGFDWWAQAFASRGYAVFQPNYRGSGGRGGAFRKAARGQWGRKMQTDLSDGVAALAARGVIDARRVCIVGASYGGYAALAGVVLQQGVYRCAVSYGGLSDLGQRLAEIGAGASDPTPMVRYEQASMGAAWTGDPVLKAISPIYHADQASAPILLIHGKDDTVVPISQSDHMAAALRHAGKPVQFVRLDGEDHWLSRQKTRTEMLDASVAFVEKWNPAN